MFSKETNAVPQQREDQRDVLASCPHFGVINRSSVRCIHRPEDFMV